MDFLKWVLKTSLLLAVMFLGLESDPQKDEADNKSETNGSVVKLLF